MPEQRKTVLVADNSPINRMFLAGILSDEYRVIEAEDGNACLDLLRSNADEVSAVLLDLMMPGKTGYEVLEEKRADSAIAGIPVIVVTAGAEIATELDALNAGAVDFLSKPIEPELAKRRIKLAIDQRELESLHVKNRIYEERQYMADHDALTGIFSKAAFCREAQQVLADDPNGEYAIVRWDIEKFKLVNALFGMETGDAILCATAQIIARHASSLGTYGRYDSDNFVVCMPYLPKRIERMAIEVIAELQREGEQLGLTQALTLAVGVFPALDRSLPIEQMCDRAGMALNTVKGDYARRVAYYDDELRLQLLEEQDILDNMDQALENGEFEVYLQPVYSLSTGLPAGAEALVRWNRPGRGIIAPGMFIPLFERNGFISKLDAQMWQQVCEILNDRRQRGLPELPISVNLSRKSLYDPHLYDNIVSLTDEYDIDPEFFRIEITESAYMDDAEQLIETVLKLQEHGFPVLMDDFGSGYSSLNTLKEIPVDVLKMDMRFMEGFERGGRVGTIMASVLRMAKWLGVPVVAEGVETVEQYEFLRTLGCEYTQGFYFAKPMPREEFEEFIKSPRVSETNLGVAYSEGNIDDIMGGCPMFDQFVENAFDGAAVYEYHIDGKLELIRASNGYFELFDIDADTFKRDVLMELLGGEDADYGKLLGVAREAFVKGAPASAELECTFAGGNVGRITATCGYSMHTGDNSALQVFAFWHSSPSEDAEAKARSFIPVGHGDPLATAAGPEQREGSGMVRRFESIVSNLKRGIDPVQEPTGAPVNPVAEAALARPARSVKRVVIATNNKHKAEEIATALDFEGWVFETLSQARITSEPEETASTFEGNARIKALAARDKCTCAVLADDSGLEVDALDGAPGVYSSRFAGFDGGDDANNEKLLEMMRDVPDEKRTARFVCTLVFIDEDGSEQVARGTIEGRIAHELCGDGGFGYDPLFLPDCFGGSITLAQVSQAQKNLVSHRGNALRHLREQLSNQAD